MRDEEGSDLQMMVAWIVANFTSKIDTGFESLSAEVPSPFPAKRDAVLSVRSGAPEQAWRRRLSQKSSNLGGEDNLKMFA